MTKGVGRHRERLASFEEALRDAKIARFNLVYVSSILPAGAKLVSVQRGLAHLTSGQVLFCVLARQDTNENRRMIASSIGFARPKNKKAYGYISEVHGCGMNESQASEYAEDLAASMLCTVLGIEYDSEATYDQKKDIWKLSNKIVRTSAATQTALGVQGEWTTTIAAAVFAK